MGRSTWVAVFIGAIVISGLAATAVADSRGFFVALALSSKSGATGPGYPGQNIQQPVNFGDVDIAYFDPTDDPNVLSFREYWAEISYGDVTIPSQTSQTFDFFNLPWRLLATEDALDGDQGGGPNEDNPNRLYWTELDNEPSVRSFNYGVGERVNELEQKYQEFEVRRDIDDPDSLEVRPVIGLNDGFFTPGERFRDVNSSGNYTYVEFVDGNMNNRYDEEQEGDTAVDADDNGRIDCPVCGDMLPRRGMGPTAGVYPEPYEDFMVRYDPTAPEGERWVKVTDEYVQQNYPGFVPGLLGRTGNGVYDSPDNWEENNDEMNPTLKVYDTGFDETQYTTPQPSWLGAFWAARYGTATPDWDPTISRLEVFDPETPDPSTDPSDDGERDFLPNQGCKFVPSGCLPLLTAMYPPDNILTAANVLPDIDGEYYDGPVEFDDLASSIYHNRPNGLGSEARWTHGDLRIGEVTSPVNFERFGATVNGLSEPIPSAGPLATNVFGTNGRPAGNMQNLELLTWRNLPDSGVSATHILATNPSQNPGKAIWDSVAPVISPGNTQSPNISYQQLYAGGFRDFNLDGLIDQGETIPFDSTGAQYSNYGISFNITDTFIGEYPFNRTRLTEDMVEALDPSFDWNQLTDQSGPYAKIIYGVTLLAPLEGDAEAVEIRERSPSFVPIRTNDTSTYFNFTNLVGSMANPGENGGLADPPIKPDFNVSVIAHEYGHRWEGWPDLYDETANDQGDPSVNQPFGNFDLMSNNSLVHPAPFLKQNINIGTGQFNGGAHRQHTPWITPVNLREVLTPGLAQTVNIPPCETRRRNAFYYFDNVAEPNRRERFYFWVVSRQGFGIREPATGMLISHIDLGSDEPTNPFPEQNQGISGGFFTYNLLQADGRRELESNVETDGIGPEGVPPDDVVIGGPNSGDAGDPWPGALNKRTWNATTLPNNRWAEGLQSGLKILDIQVTPNFGRAVTFLWDPKEIPSLSFLQPPGGDSNNPSGNCEIYRLDYTAFDFGGGTDIEFYLDDDDEGYNGQIQSFDLVADIPGDCAVGSTTTIVSKTPGTIEGSVPVNIGDLPDGEYFFYARLLPHTNSEGQQEPFATVAYPSSSNLGEGDLDIISVDDSVVKLETWTVFMNPDGLTWSVEGSQSGVQVNQAEEGTPYTTDDGGVTFEIHQDGGGVAFGPGDRFVFLTTGLTPYSAGLKVRDGIALSEPVAIFQPMPATGAIPLDVTFVSTSLDPTDETLTHTWDFGDGTGSSSTDFVTMHTYENPGSYTVTLTVSSVNGTDSTTRVVTAIINEAPEAHFTVDPTSGVAPIDVDFDATASFDPEGTALTLKWNFGDSTPLLEGPYTDANVRMPTHTYQQLGVYTPTLTVTDAGGASASSNAVIQFTGNSAPFATFSASPTSGGSPLTVSFDASGSSDPDNDPLTFSWDFGDGGMATGAVVQHTYTAIGDYTAKLTVSDGLSTSSDTRLIEVQNQPPVASLTANPTSGIPPLTVTLDASGSYDPEGGALTYNWIFGDGTSATDAGPVQTHTYQTIGSFTARVTAIDPDNDSAIKLLTITLTVPPNRAPNIALSGDPMSGPANLNVSFDLSGTNDPDGDPVTLSMDFGDGNVIVNLLPSSQVSHTYQSAGSFTVLAIGSDGKGATGSAQLVVQVTNGGGGGGDGGTGQPAPGACASGIAQAMFFGLIGLLLMSIGSTRRRFLR